MQVNDIYILHKLAIRSRTRIVYLACKRLSTARNNVLFQLSAFMEVLTEHSTLVKYMAINVMQR